MLGMSFLFSDYLYSVWKYDHLSCLSSSGCLRKHTPLPGCLRKTDSL